jgi:transketolase
MPELLGGSADLTGSNNTRAKGMTAVAAASNGGRYIHYGVREHAMAAVMNGIALHGGYVPFGGTFLVFSDYCRPAIRLSALMGQRVIHVMTHDSIGLGEDGPTHQPVEHLATLRAIPNLTVMRPADAVETAECWEAALLSTTGPTLLSLSRQNLPLLRHVDDGENRSLAGGYVLAEAAGSRQVTLIGSGSEVAIAMQAREILHGRGIRAAVVSMPAPTVFARLDSDRREAVIGADGHPRVVVEAGLRLGWDTIIGARGAFVGMTDFGASGPAPELYAHFGITAERIAEIAAGLLGREA